jgi:hypothetical protein
MPHSPPPPPPRSPPRRSNRGCVIALAVVGGVGTLVVGGAAFGIYRFAHSEQGKMLVGTVGDVAGLALDAQHAPGAKEVAALGCDSAMAMDMDRMQRILHERMDASASPPAAFSVMVVCQVGMFGKAPACEDVARTYLAAAGPPARGFVVSVQRGAGRARPICAALYDSGGTLVKDMSAAGAPAIPGAK